MIAPSKCQQCVPTETLTPHSGLSWTVELTHEPTCPNHPEANHAA